MNWLRQLSGRYRVGDDPLRTLRRIELVALLLGLLLCLQLAWGGLRLLALAAPGPVAPAADSLQVPAVVGPGACRRRRAQRDHLPAPVLERPSPRRHGGGPGRSRQ